MNSLRRISITLIALFIIIATARAQNFYVHIGAGYNFESGRDVLSIAANSSGEENVYGSFGKGLGWYAGLGYLFSENVGGEVSFSMLTGAEYKATYSDAAGASGTRTLKGSMMRLTPAIKVTVGKGLQPYCRFGLVIGINPKLEGRTSIKYAGGSVLRTDKMYGGNPLGFMGALGVDNKLSDLISFFVEINFIGQRWAADKNEWTVTDTDGGVITKESGTTTFVDKLDSHVPESDVFDIPLEELKMYKPFSSFGISAGIKMTFGFKKASR